MDVYHNGDLRGTGRLKDRLTPFSIDHTFTWEGQEILIPAIYAGKAGAALDVCARIPVEDMAAFLKKWDMERRLALKTKEEYEQIDADNPSSGEFSAELQLNGTPLIHSMSSSLNWFPREVFQMGNPHPVREDEWENDKAAEILMDAYGCDRTSCWHFVRLTYNWRDTPLLPPQNISLTFRANPITVAAGHFTTDSSCDKETVKVIHPVTGQEYTLTLHECKLLRHSLADFGETGFLYPEYCFTLSYCITPEIERDHFDIRDCAESDQPRAASSPEAAGCNGPTAIFMAGKDPSPDRRTAVSSLHFEPAQEVCWRMVFQVRTKEDMTVNISHISSP